MRPRRPFPVLYLFGCAIAALIIVVATASLTQLSRAHQVAERQSLRYAVPLMTAQASSPSVVAIGDSYVSGGGASDTRSRFINLLAAREGWNLTLLSRGGTGYVSSLQGSSAETGCGLSECVNFSGVIQLARDTHPDIVFVFGGRNDAEVPPSVEADGIKSFYTGLREAMPNVRIVVVLPIWGADDAPTTIRTMRNDVASDAGRVGASVIDIGEPLAGMRELMSADGVHPNDAGHQVIAKAIESRLEDGGADK